MKKMKVIMGIIIFFVLAFIYAHIGKTVSIFDTQIDSSLYNNTGELIETVVEQEFTSQEDNLDGIRVKCKIFGNPEGSFLQYSLIDMGTNKEVAKGKADAGKVKVTKFFEFKFDTIKNCDGKRYKFVVKPISAETNQSIGFVFENGIEKDTKLTLNDEKVQGTLIMRTVTRRFDFEYFGVVVLFGAYIAFFFNFLYKLFKR